MATSLTIDSLHQLDIQVGRMIGLLKDPKYTKLMKEYELDSAQCDLWWEVVQLLTLIMDKYDYEDLVLDNHDLGLETKKILAESEKFIYLGQLLEQYDILHSNLAVGKIVEETMEDIGIIYRSVAKELASILASQKEIQKIVDKS